MSEFPPPPPPPPSSPDGPPPGSPPRSPHRHARTSRAGAGPVARSVVLSLAAVAAVAALVVGIWLAFGTGGPTTARGGGSSPSDRTGALAATTTVTPSSTSPTPTTPAATTASRSPTPAPSPARTSPTHPVAPRTTTPPRHTTTHTTVPAPAHPPLLVLNNSRITGLAARAAAQFAAGGWPIADTGNFTGRIPVTTVYYEPGQEAAARALAAQFPAIRRARERFVGLPGHGLTVVVTRDFAG